MPTERNRPPIEFFWDPSSPYTYLAATRMQALSTETGTEVRWRVFLLGGVFKATGNRAPTEIPAKGRHLVEDLHRWARFYNVAFRMPDSFPANSVLPTRVALAAEDAGHDPAEVARIIMAAHWIDGVDIGKPETFGPALAAAGLDAEALLTRATDTDIKNALRASTEEAVARGAFGAPTFFVGDTLFWGNDRLPLLRDHLAGTANER